jgi:glutathione S-transferase
VARYRVYLSEVSYFSGKLEGALRAKRIAYERVPITPARLLHEVLPATGWMKVPAMRRDDGLWLHDTTPMLDWLDTEHPERSLTPEDPYRRFMSQLIEDYCDEWQWRPAMVWRWGWADNARYLGARLGRELSAGTPHPAWAMGLYFRHRQQRIYLRGDGVRPHNREAIAARYPQALGWLEGLLRDRPYLLGHRPSRVDLAWFGPMFRHYAQDPRPAAVMAAEAPRVWAWVSRVWASGLDGWPADGLEDFSDSGWTPMLADIGSAYLPYLQDNARALAEGRPRFSGRYGGIDYPELPAIHYRLRCWWTLRAAFAALPAAARTEVEARLAGLGIVEALQGPAPGGPAPLIDSALARPAPPLSRWRRLQLYLGGTAWAPATRPDATAERGG